mgnify:CR=1 FL=1
MTSRCPRFAALSRAHSLTPSYNKPFDDVQMAPLGCSSNGGLSNREVICHCPLEQLQVSTFGCLHPCPPNESFRAVILPPKYFLLRFYHLKGSEIRVGGWIVPMKVRKPICHAHQSRQGGSGFERATLILQPHQNIKMSSSCSSSTTILIPRTALFMEPLQQGMMSFAGSNCHCFASCRSVRSKIPR